MSDEAVRATRRGRVLEVVLDRPKANAIDSETSRAAPTAASNPAPADGAVDVLVICAGCHQPTVLPWIRDAA